MNFDLANLNVYSYKSYIPSLVGVRSIGAEIWALPVLAPILNFGLSDLNVYSYRSYIPSLVGVRSVGAEI